ncbi:MAG: hypothetical protein VKL59_20585 [Nostocaceae cyanobacterium]|nr:hypothetical protein [Nostocaceae cyanobacterium]
MLAQFHKLYPTGSIISELLQIHEGKYLVRVEVHIEGVKRATGMAAAETLEIAEDRARDRAIALVLIAPTTSHQTQSPAPIYASASPTPDPRPDESTGLTNTLATPNFPSLHGADRPFSNFEPPQENWGKIPDSPTLKQPSSSVIHNNVKQFLPRQGTPQEETSPVTHKSTAEPTNHSDTIAQIDVQMERLSWTTEQGRDYLKKTYSKRARSLLSDEELKDFLRYLESQPTPIDPSMGF